MNQHATPDITMDANALYQEETFTDQRVGTIRRMTPIKPDGSVDEARAIQFVGQAQMMTPAGVLPLTFEIEASNLEEAIEKFGDGANQALEDTMKQLEEMRREQASRIMVPGEQSSQIQIP